jgi:hypothetical protein
MVNGLGGLNDPLLQKYLGGGSAANMSAAQQPQMFAQAKKQSSIPAFAAGVGATVGTNALIKSGKLAPVIEKLAPVTDKVKPVIDKLAPITDKVKPVINKVASKISSSGIVAKATTLASKAKALPGPLKALGLAAGALIAIKAISGKKEPEAANMSAQQNPYQI